LIKISEQKLINEGKGIETGGSRKVNRNLLMKVSEKKLMDEEK
jgi:hypothetical protein